MVLKINESLKIVVPLYDANDAIYAYVHAAPVSREVFEANWKLLSRTYVEMAQLGLVGARMAWLALRDTARTIAGDDTEGDALVKPLADEMQRLSNVILPDSSGWGTMPLVAAVAERRIDADDAREVMSAITFFTAASHMHPKAARDDFLSGGAKMWGAQTSSLNATDFAASLPTSTPAVPLTEKSNEAPAAWQAASSLPL